MTAKNDGADVVWADMRDSDKVLSGAGKLLDLAAGRAAVRRVPASHPRFRRPAGIVARYLAALAPGSYLVISHATDEFSPEKMQANAEVADNSGTMLIPRSRTRSCACSTGAS